MIKILAIDDNSTDLIVLERILKGKTDFKVTTCCTGDNALELINKHNYDLIIVDAIMPVLDGYETCQLIKKKYPRLPVIIITGLNDDDSIKRAFSVGAFDYIIKPIRDVELISRVNKALKISSSENKILDMYSEILDDLEVAHRIQTHFLPSWFKLYETFYATSAYYPKDRVSGDVFDLIRLTEDKYFAYVGDISGHGIQAAFLMTAIQTTVRFLTSSIKSDFTEVEFINQLCSQVEKLLPDSSYLTAIAGIINTKTNKFSYFSAGHPPILRYNMKTSKVTPIPANSSLPVGLFGKSVFSEADINVIDVDINSIYVLYTDGIFECTDKNNNELEFDRFIEELSLINVSKTLNPLHDKLIHNLIHEAYTFQDDVTFISFQVIKRSNKIQYFEFTHTKSTIESITDKIINFIDLNISSNSFINKVELAVTELINNIILHGFDENMLRVNIRILIVAEWYKKRLKLSFYDKGKKWEYADIINNTSNFDVEDLYSESGRGWKIINQLTSNISINRHYRLNETILTFLAD